jgi:hypothetical protein
MQAWTKKKAAELAAFKLRSKKKPPGRRFEFSTGARQLRPKRKRSPSGPPLIKPAISGDTGALY